MLWGAHVSSGGGILSAIERARALGADAAQIFTQSSRQWRATRHDPAALAAYAATARTQGVAYTLCHAIYFINLASTDDVVYHKSVAALIDTTRIAAAIGADVVVHVGSHLGAGLDATMHRVQAAFDAALALLSDEQWLLLENSAGAGDTIGRDVSELARVISASGHDRIGLCLDSCHLFVSGVDVRDATIVDALFDRVDDEIGLERLRALHVNDAAAELGSNRDRHANLTEGVIGADMGVFLSHPAVQGLPAIVETAGGEGRGPDRREMERLRALHAQGVTQRAASAQR